MIKIPEKEIIALAQITIELNALGQKFTCSLYGGYWEIEFC